jgi:probable blue pigment (indigoidine) exporter
VRRGAVAVPSLIAATACWGVGTVVTKQVLDDVEPLTLLPLQLCSSCLMLGAVALARREPVEWNPSVRRLAALGVLNPGLAYALGLVGLVTITASMSVLLWAAEPVLIMLLAVVLLRDRVPPALAALLAVALTGVLLIVYEPGASGEPIGVVLTMLGVGCCALYTVLTRHLVLDDTSLTVVLAQQLAALAFAVLLATVVELGGGSGWEVGAIGAGGWAGAAASGVLYYGAAFWFYLVGLRRMSASAAGAFLPLIPVFGVAAGYLTGERLADRQWLGAAIVIAATAAIAVRADRSARRARSGV